MSQSACPPACMSAVLTGRAYMHVAQAAGCTESAVLKLNVCSSPSNNYTGNAPTQTLLATEKHHALTSLRHLHVAPCRLVQAYHPHSTECMTQGRCARADNIARHQQRRALSNLGTDPRRGAGSATPRLVPSSGKQKSKAPGAQMRCSNGASDTTGAGSASGRTAAGAAAEPCTAAGATALEVRSFSASRLMA